MFNRETYVKRQQELIKNVNSGLILLPGNDESPMNYADNPYHFRQDSTFLYYFGLTRPGLYALMDTNNGRVSIYGDDYTVEDFVWMGKQPIINDLAGSCGVEYTGTMAELQNSIIQARKRKEVIHFLPPYRPGNSLKICDLLGIPSEKINEESSAELIRAVVSQRSYKTEEEVAEIEKAETSMTKIF